MDPQFVSSGIPSERAAESRKLGLGVIPPEISDLFGRFDAYLRELTEQQALTWDSAKNVRRFVRRYLESIRIDAAAAAAPDATLRSTLLGRPQQLIEAHLAAVSDKYAPPVAASVKAGIAKFYRWLKAEHLSEYDPAEIKKIAVPTQHQPIAVIDEWVVTLRSCDATKTLVKSRVRRFFEHLSVTSGQVVRASVEVGGLERLRGLSQKPQLLEGGRNALCLKGSESQCIAPNISVPGTFGTAPEHGLPGSLTELVCLRPTECLTSYLTYLKGKHGDDHKVLKHPLSALRQFYLWLKEEGLVGELPRELQATRRGSPGTRTRALRPLSGLRPPEPVPEQPTSALASHNPAPPSALTREPRPRRTQFLEPALSAILMKRDQLIQLLLRDPEGRFSFGTQLKMSRSCFDGSSALWLPLESPVLAQVGRAAARLLQEYVSLVEASPLGAIWKSPGTAPLFLSGDGGSITADDNEEALELPAMFFEQRNRAVSDLVRHSPAAFSAVRQIQRTDMADSYDRFYPHSPTGSLLIPECLQRTLRSYCEIVRASELGSIWCAPGLRPLFLSADGGTLTADEPCN